jgi:nitric oxide reductase activation protein
VDVRDGESPARLVSRWVYPEWDGLEGRYRPDWCVVSEIPLGWVSDRTHTSLTVARDPWLERSFSALALGLERHRRQRDGDRLDLDRTIELASVFESARRRGEGTLDRQAIHSAMRRTRRDLAALLLVDVSGSSAEREHGGSTVLGEQWQATSALVQALAAVDDRVAAVAFHSRGRDAVRVVTLKDFHERWSRDAGSAMRSLRASGYTRLGTAIRHGAHRLLHDSGAERRLLVIVSDGFPFDLGYSGEYARRDVERALEECAEQEVRILWICFGSMDPGLAGLLSASSFPLLTADRYASLRRRLVPSIASALLTRAEPPRLPAASRTRA